MIPQIEEKPAIEPDFRVIRFNETKDWSEDIVARTKGGKIWSVYVFDKNQVTHLCEFSPSYCFHFIEDYAEMDGGEQSPDDLHDEIQSAETPAVMYMHCSDIDDTPEEKMPKIVLDAPYDPEKHRTREEWYEAELESALEYARCNQLI